MEESLPLSDAFFGIEKYINRNKDSLKSIDNFYDKIVTEYENKSEIDSQIKNINSEKQELTTSIEKLLDKNKKNAAEITETIKKLSTRRKEADDLICKFQKTLTDIDDLCKNVKDKLDSKVENNSEEIDKVSKNLSDSLNNFVSTKKESADEISKRIERVKEQRIKIATLLEVFQSLENYSFSQSLFDQIYSKVNDIKTDYRMFDTYYYSKIKNEENRLSLGLKNKFNAFLFGEFSSGKTTLIQRILNTKAGEVASRPTTAFLVIHMSGSEENAVITFKKKFIVSNSDDFDKFLSDWKIRDLLERDNGSEWSVIDCERTELKPEFCINHMIEEFLIQANAFPSAISQIEWIHRKPANSGLKFLDFFNLYDMPGAGADNETHEDNINYVLKKYEPDVVIYLVSTQQSVPSPDGIKLIKKILSSIQETTEFFWTYEFPDGNESMVDIENGDFKFDECFFVGNKDTDKGGILKSLKDFIDKEDNLNSKAFTAEEKNKLNDSCVLDLRGKKSDTVLVQSAMTLVLQRMILNYFTKFLPQITNNFKNDKESSNPYTRIMNYKNKMESENTNLFSDIQRKISDECQKNRQMTTDEAKNIILKILEIYDNDELPSLSTEREKARKVMMNQINLIVDEIVKSFKKSPMVNKIDLNKVAGLSERVTREPEWATLLVKVQMMHWLVFGYGEDAIVNMIQPGLAILDRIRLSVDELKELKTNIPILRTIK